MAAVPTAAGDSGGAPAAGKEEGPETVHILSWWPQKSMELKLHSGNKKG